MATPQGQDQPVAPLHGLLQGNSMHIITLIRKLHKSVLQIGARDAYQFIKHNIKVQQKNKRIQDN